MNRLIEFSQHLRDAKLVNTNKFDSWAEDITLEPTEKDTEQGLLIGSVRYTAVLSLEGCNANPMHLAAVIMAWIRENDPDRNDMGLSDPQLIADVSDSAKNISDIEVSLDFKDDIYLVEDPTGSIHFDGKTWGFGDFDLWVAEEGSVGHNADE